LAAAYCKTYESDAKLEHGLEGIEEPVPKEPEQEQKQ
jgi:hypothetical protein